MPRFGMISISAVVCFVNVFGISWVFFTLYKRFFGLRVSEAPELAGLDIPEMGSVGYAPDAEPYRTPTLALEGTSLGAGGE